MLMNDSVQTVDGCRSRARDQRHWGLLMGKLQVLRLLLRVMRNLRMKRDSLGCPKPLDALLSDKLPSTASATGRFGLGAITVFADVQLAVRTDPAPRWIEISFGGGFLVDHGPLLFGLGRG